MLRDSKSHGKNCCTHFMRLGDSMGEWECLAAALSLLATVCEKMMRSASSRVCLASLGSCAELYVLLRMLLPWTLCRALGAGREPCLAESWRGCLGSGRTSCLCAPEACIAPVSLRSQHLSFDEQQAWQRHLQLLLLCIVAATCAVQGAVG